MKLDAFKKKLAECLFEPEENIGEDTVLKDLDGWDSLGRLSVVAFLQEGFGVVVETKTLMKCGTIGDIIRLVQDRLES